MENLNNFNTLTASKMKAINRDKIIEASIIEPYEFDSEAPFGSSHGWQVLLVVGYTMEGYPIQKNIDMENEDQCIEFIKGLNFVLI